MTSPRAPAIVVRMDLNGLGVVRSLAKGKVPVIAVDRSFEKNRPVSCVSQKESHFQASRDRNLLTSCRG